MERRWWRDIGIALFLVVWCGVLVFVFLVSNGAFAASH